MTIQPSFMYRVWENIRITLEEVRAEFNAECPDKLLQVQQVCYGETVVARQQVYIMLSDVRGESGQGFRYSYATNHGGSRGSMTRNAKGVFIFDILVYAKDSNRRIRFISPNTNKPVDVSPGGRPAFDVGWRIFELFERKVGKDVTLGFPDPSDVLLNDNKKHIQVTQDKEDIRFLNYEIDEVYGNLNLTDVDGVDRFLDINVRVSVNARLDVPII